MPKGDKKNTNTSGNSNMVAVGGVAIIGCIILASCLYAMIWPIRMGGMALWCILFSNAVYPDPKDNAKNTSLKVILLVIFVGGSLIPGLLIPNFVKKVLLILSLFPHIHMLVLLRQAANAQENKKKKKDKNEQAANAAFTKGVMVFTGFILLSLGITVYSILSD